MTTQATRKEGTALGANVAEHTPGPWHVLKSNHVLKVMDDKGVFTDLLVCDIVSTYGDESKANALLIAAAPEMLATLQDAANSLEAFPLWLDTIGQKEKAGYIREINSRNRAIISKARLGS